MNVTRAANNWDDHISYWTVVRGERFVFMDKGYLSIKVSME